MSRILLLICVIATTLCVAPHSVAADVPIETAIESIRKQLNAPMVAADNGAILAIGSGTAMGMDLSILFRFDDSGNFVFDGRGKLLVSAGYDGTSPWKRDMSGNTRVMTGHDKIFVLVPHWVISGHWIAKDSPLTLSPSHRKPGRNEVTIDLRLDNNPLIATMFVDTKTWLPKRLVVNTSGMDFGMRFDEWHRIEERYLPKKVSITSDGKESERFVIESYRPDDEVVADTYAPHRNVVDKRYDERTSTKIDVERGRWGHHFVRPRINGKIIEWLAVDTGAGMTHLDDDVARELGIEIIGKTHSTGVGGLVTDNKMGVIESIELGPLTIKNLPIIISDLDNLGLGHPSEKGLIGMDFLRHCVIEYDQKNSKIELHDPQGYELSNGEWQRLLDHNGKPFVSMPFEGHDGLFTIDTGNPGGVIVSPHTVEKYGLLDNRETRSSSIGGFGGRVNVEKGSLEWVEWGDRHFKDVPADFVTEDQGAGADRARDGIIGTDLLQRYLVVFDMVHGRIAYLPN